MTAHAKLPPEADAWLADHPGLTRSDLEAPWRLAAAADPLAEAPAPDPARIDALRRRLDDAARPALRRVPGGLRWPYLAAAACVVLLLGAGLFFWFRAAPLHYTAGPGERLAVTLPDGSTVELNSRSALTAPRTFDGGVRRVTLHGEAFFDVERAGTPFIIETFNADVRVLGTSFNVRAWPGAETRVAVLTGTVEVEARSAETAERSVVLEAGQAGHVADAGAAYTPLSTGVSATTAWRTGGFFVDDEPYGVLFDEIERRFGVQIDAPAAIRARRRTFIKQQATSAEAVLRDFCLSVGLRYRTTANGFEVYGE